jgi:hypothetical protein
VRIDGALVMSVDYITEHLRKFRTKEMHHLNEHEGDGLEEKYIEGYLDGIEAAKNEVWKLNGEF